VEIDVLDLFCGCGGASLGFQMASKTATRYRYRVIGGIDIDRYALATYARNLSAPALNVDLSKVRKTDLPAVLEKTARTPGNPLFLIGCAPCQAFSSHTKTKQDTRERRNLLPKLADIASVLLPEAILIENVPELLADRNWRFFLKARTKLEKSGYVVRARIFNLAEFGLPQERFRAVIMAFKAPFQLPEGLLSPSEFRTVRQTISHLPPLRPGGENHGDPMHITSNHRPSTVAILKQVPKNGGNRPIGVGPKCLDKARGRFGGYTDVYGRLAWDRPALTITARCRTPSCGRFAHPEQNRGLSIREAALLQGFPETFMCEGPFDDKFKQIGNAVPPLAAKYFAEHMLQEYLRIQCSRPAQMNCNGDITEPIGPGFSILINGIKKRRATIGDATYCY
jgi:DNA (cytosine-5)-methyltransferase 1